MAIQLALDSARVTKNSHRIECLCLSKSDDVNEEKKSNRVVHSIVNRRTLPRLIMIKFAGLLKLIFNFLTFGSGFLILQVGE